MNFSVKDGRADVQLGFQLGEPEQALFLITGQINLSSRSSSLQPKKRKTKQELPLTNKDYNTMSLLLP